MKQYLLDTNCLLRFLLKDNIPQAAKIQSLFQEAKAGKNTIYIPLVCCVEIIFALRRVYKLQKKDIIEHLSKFFDLPYISIEKRELLLHALLYYRDYSVSVVDAICFIEARERGEELMTFDENLKKLIKRTK